MRKEERCMKKTLGKKMSKDAGNLVSYACGCWCYASCSCPYTNVNPNGTVEYAQNYANNAQNDSKLLVIHM